MSIRVMMQVSDIKTGSPARKLILLTLADNANDAGLVCPELSAIAQQCEMAKSTVQRHIASMEESGILTIIRRMEDTASLSNHYQLHLGEHHEH